MRHLLPAVSIALLLAAAYVFCSRRTESLSRAAATPPPLVEVAVRSEPPPPAAAAPPPVRRPATPPPALKPAPEEELAALTPKLDLHEGMLPWEAQILRILSLPSPDGTKAQLLFALLATLPEEALATATDQAAEWLRDRDYATTALPFMLNPNTHGAIQSILFADLMQRPDAVALPVLLSIARQPNHPFAPFARDNLDLLLGKDLGTNWGAWEAAIRQRLATGQ